MEAERELVRRVLAGDRNAFRDLVAQYQRLVAHLVFRVVRDREDAAELCQDVFARVHRKLDQWGGEAKLGTWIGRIAYRVCLNHLEKRRLPLHEESGAEPGSGAGLTLDEVPSGAPSALDALAAGELRSLVRAQVDTLPAVQRSVVTLFHLEGMSVGEVAQVMELPEGTVKSHLFRARKTLKDGLLARYATEELHP